MLKEVVFTASALALISGCSLFEGDDDKTGTTTPLVNEETDDAPVLLTGRFIDSPVQGLRYNVSKKLYKDNPYSSSEITSSGVTNENGEYFYNETDENIMFFIGGMLVASGPVGQIFTPLDVNYVRHSEDVISASKEEYLHPDAPVNLARLLQTLDSDGYPENGITITEETANEFSNSFESIYGTEVFDQSTEGFASHLEEHIGEYTNTSTLVSVEDAVNHMSASLSDLKSDYTINLVGQTWVTQLKELRQYVSFDNRDSWGEPTICTETDMNIYSIDKYHTNHVEVEIHDNFNATTCTATGSRSFETTNYGRYTMCPSSECNYSDLNRITGWEENSEENHRREKETRHHIMGSDKVITIHEIQFTDDDKDYWQVARYESARNP